MADGALQGLSKLTAQLNALKSLDDGKVLRAAVRAGMGYAYDRAAAAVPVGTVAHRTYDGLLVAPGFARENIRIITTINDQKNIASAVMGFRRRAYYILQFVDRGTRYQKAQPFFRNAFLTARDDAENGMRNVLELAVIKAARSA